MGEFLLVLACLSAIVTWLALFPLRQCLRAWRMIDVPNERSSHNRPTPRGGGVAIVGVTLIGLLAYQVLVPVASWTSLLPYIVGAVLLATVSWLDDAKSLPNRVRFAAQGTSAVLAILGFGYWHTISLPMLGQLDLGWLGLPVTFVWIVGLTNAYNFMDGIDGIAGAQAVVAGLGWAALGWLSQQPWVGALGLLLAASSLGFLWHNWPPARIFMGDVGSAFLGYTFAILPLAFSSLSSLSSLSASPELSVNAGTAPLVGALLLWPFVFDASFTFLRRLRSGENVFQAHRSHLYQRLVIAGYSHRAVTTLYMGLATVGLVLALLFTARPGMAGWLVVVGLPLAATGLGLFVSRREGHRRLTPRAREHPS